MFPDFIAAKHAISKKTEGIVTVAGLHTPLLRMVRKYHIHEGAGFRIEGEDDWVDEKTIQPSEMSVEIAAQDIQQHGPKAFADLPRRFAEQMRSHASRNAYKSLDDVTSRAGTVVVSSGPPSPESLLAGLKAIDLEFDEHGRWKPQTLVCHPDQAEAALPPERIGSFGSHAGAAPGAASGRRNKLTETPTGSGCWC